MQAPIIAVARTEKFWVMHAKSLSTLTLHVEPHGAMDVMFYILMLLCLPVLVLKCRCANHHRFT